MDSAAADWFAIDFKDSAWITAQTGRTTPARPIAGFPAQPPLPLFAAAPGAIDTAHPAPQPTPSTLNPTFFRRTLSLSVQPRSGALYLSAEGAVSAFINGRPLSSDSGTKVTANVAMWDLTGKFKTGKNVLAIKLAPQATNAAVYPLLQLKIGHTEYAAKPPLCDKPLPSEQVRADAYEFPFIKNFDREKGASKQ
jgi:hypothetical protein